jgi:hypothetical protein
MRPWARWTLPSVAGVLCVVGGQLTEHHFPWGLPLVLIGGYMVGWMGARVK